MAGVGVHERAMAAAKKSAVKKAKVDAAEAAPAKKTTKNAMTAQT